MGKCRVQGWEVWRPLDLDVRVRVPTSGWERGVSDGICGFWRGGIEKLGECNERAHGGWFGRVAQGVLSQGFYFFYLVV